MSAAHTLAQRWDHFWHDNEVLRIRLTTFRVVFFGMLAFDLWTLMLPHAPRYGVNGFNVSHLTFLDGLLPIPTPSVVTLLYLLGGFLAMRVAIGLATRWSLIGLTAIYSGMYFWSQLDSYQHHYLICLLLLLSCFLPQEALNGVDRDAAAARRAADYMRAAKEPLAPDPASDRIRSWAARLMYVQVSIVYCFTAITKTTHYWVNGWALERVIQTPGMRHFLAVAADTVHRPHVAAYAFTAIVIMCWQYFVAMAFLFPRLRPIACITGPMFHILVQVIDLKIGWFSYYMLGIYYILLFPDPWFLALGRPVGRLLARLGGTYRAVVRAKREQPGQAAMVAVATGLCVVVLVVSYVPVAATYTVAIVLGATVTVTAWPRTSRIGARPLLRAGLQLAIIVVMVIDLRGAGVLYDYHRYWAGDLARRGDLAAAAEHYEVANSLTSSGPARFFVLGEIDERLGHDAAARQAFREGLVRAPHDARGLRDMADLRSRTR